jgi:hypothetical protein
VVRRECDRTDGIAEVNSRRSWIAQMPRAQRSTCEGAGSRSVSAKLPNAVQVIGRDEAVESGSTGRSEDDVAGTGSED